MPLNYVATMYIPSYHVITDINMHSNYVMKNINTSLRNVIPDINMLFEHACRDVLVDESQRKPFSLLISLLISYYIPLLVQKIF